MKKKITMLLAVIAILIGIVFWYKTPIDLINLHHNAVREIVVFNGNSGNWKQWK